MGYSGAAILGTLVLFVLFGVIGVSDISGALFDFIFSAPIGGGLMAFLALNKSTSEFAGKAGDKLLSAADSLGEKLGESRCEGSSPPAHAFGSPWKSFLAARFPASD